MKRNPSPLSQSSVFACFEAVNVFRFWESTSLCNLPGPHLLVFVSYWPSFQTAAPYRGRLYAPEPREFNGLLPDDPHLLYHAPVRPVSFLPENKSLCDEFATGNTDVSIYCTRERTFCLSASTRQSWQCPEGTFRRAGAKRAGCEVKPGLMSVDGSCTVN